MSDNQIEEIKSKVDIVSIIGEHVQLTKSGTNFKGLCPFHSEKTPSFMVSPELQIYKCFGCNESGDVFTFLEKYEGMEFSEALRYLAEKTGVKLTSFGGIQTSEKDVLYEINNLAAKFYNYLLVTHPIGKVALNYLKEERKTDETSIKIFNIGFAPHGKNVLSDFLIKKKKYKIADIERSGLIYKSRNGKIYDRFAGRIIFPITDNRGNVIALAGRQVPPERKDSGKYINSPETQIYHKSSSLYGLSITKDFIKKEGFSVVVEGEIDLVSSFQTGVKNIVAIKGSAFTEEQARLLGRYTKEVVLALDSDFAGIAASIRGIKILTDNEFEVRVATLGKYKDPDDVARSNPAFLMDQIKNAMPVWDFVIDSVVAKYPKETAGGKAKISKELTPILAGITNKIVQEHYINKLAKMLSVSEEAVIEEVEKKQDKEEKFYEFPFSNQASNTKPIKELREEKLVGLILKIKPGLLKDERIRKIITIPVLKRLLDEFDGNPKNLAKELLTKYGELTLLIEETHEIEIKKEINNLYRLLNLDKLKEKYKNARDLKLSVEYQKKYKDFDSYNFERIIT